MTCETVIFGPMGQAFDLMRYMGSNTAGCRPDSTVSEHVTGSDSHTTNCGVAVV